VGLGVAEGVADAARLELTDAEDVRDELAGAEGVLVEVTVWVLSLGINVTLAFTPE
jgi:hypothetical protein